MEIAENKGKEIRSFYDSANKRKDMERWALDVKRKHLSMSRSICEKNRYGNPGIIAEFKRMSPSKGLIFPYADVEKVVPYYERGGAAACSVLTDTRYFGGALTDLAVARKNLDIPVLRKDFIIDEIQIAEANLYGADAILLIASLLSSEDVARFTDRAHEYGLEVLFEVHDVKEIEKIIPEVDMVGVNNRALSTFVTDVNHSAGLIDYLPKDKPLIAESGIKTKEDIESLMECGFHGFLIGETFMRSPDIEMIVKEFSHVS